MISKKRGSIIAIFISIFTFFLYYLFWDSTPAPLPSNHQLVKKMNQHIPEAYVVDVIQDTIYLDEKNVFVPFITKNKAYGTSFWVWKDRKWHVAEVHVSDMLKLWELKNNDPSSYQFVWNFPPNEKINFTKIYFIKERMYTRNDETHHYEPRIQMEERITNQGMSYGVLPIPMEWVTVINETSKLQSNQQQDLVSQLFNTQKQYYFGWNTYDMNNNQEFLVKDLNHSFSWNSDTDIEVEYVFNINQGELEYPE